MSGPSDPATTQTPAPGPTPSRTVSPPVLQQRAPLAISHEPVRAGRAGHCCLPCQECWHCVDRQPAHIQEISILHCSRLQATYVHQSI